MIFIAEFHRLEGRKKLHLQHLLLLIIVGTAILIWLAPEWLGLKVWVLDQLPCV